VLSGRIWGLFDEIGFHRVVENPARNEASVRHLKDMVMARIALPVSKRQSVDMLEREYGVKLDLNTVYRAMDYLDEDAVSKIGELAYRHTTGLIGAEGDTLKKALEKLRQTYKIEKVVFVADAALLNKDNIALLETDEHKQEFILGARIKNMSFEITRQIVDKSAYKPLYGEDNIEGITFHEIMIDHGGKKYRLIITYSPTRAAKDRHDREKAIEQLGKRIGRSKNPKSLLSNYGYKKFVSVEGEAKLVRDEDKIKEAEQWDGLHGIYTNIMDQTAVELLTQYKGLWQVEETFRISKHDLSMRPIFHWTPRRIKAHIALCFMALVCVRTAEYRVALQYKKLSPHSIRTALLDLEISILKDYMTNKVYALPSKASQDAKKIYQIMGLRWTDVPYLVK